MKQYGIFKNPKLRGYGPDYLVLAINKLTRKIWGEPIDSGSKKYCQSRLNDLKTEEE